MANNKQQTDKLSEKINIILWSNLSLSCPPVKNYKYYSLEYLLEAFA